MKSIGERSGGVADFVQRVALVVGWLIVGAGALAALSGGAAIVWGFARRSIAARYVARRRVERLAAGVRHAYFTEILGEPAIERSTERGAEYVYVSPWFYVSALVNEATVIAFFVTLRRRRSRARFSPASSGARLRRGYVLGRATFNDLSDRPTAAHGWIGARRSGYLEAHYFGNPGNYQTFLVGVNDAGANHVTAPMVSLFGFEGPYEHADLSQPDRLATFLADAAVSQFRSSARPNTFGATAPLASFDDLSGLGVDLDRVRILP